MLTKTTQYLVCIFASMHVSASPFDQVGDLAVYTADKDGTKFSYTFLAVGKDGEGRLCGEGKLETEGTSLVFDYVHLGGEEYEVATRLKSLEEDGSPKVAKRKAMIRPGRELTIQGMNAYFPTEFVLQSESKPRDWKTVRERNYYFKQGAAASSGRELPKLKWERGRKNVFKEGGTFVFVCPEERFTGYENPVDLRIAFTVLDTASDGRVFGVGSFSVKENGKELSSRTFLWKQASDVSGVVQFRVKDFKDEGDWQELMVSERDGSYQFSGWAALRSKLSWKFSLLLDNSEFGDTISEESVEYVRAVVEGKEDAKLPKKVAPKEDFSIVGKMSVQRKSGWVTVVARIQNNTDRDYESVFVSFALLDAQGNPLGKTLGSISGLRAGQSKVVESSARDTGAKSVELDSIEGYEH